MAILPGWPPELRSARLETRLPRELFAGSAPLAENVPALI